MAKVKDSLKKLADKLTAARRLEVPSVENMVRQQEAALKAAAQVKAEKG